MDVDATLLIVGLAALTLSASAIRLAMPVAARLGLVDEPGGHKQHDDPVPLVGGVGIFSALTVVLVAEMSLDPGGWPLFGALLLGAGLLFLVGLADDLLGLGVRVRFVAQGLAATITALWGGLLLQDFGDLLGSGPVVLGVLALPVTLFATAGVINALNMVDGIDGLSGSLSLVSLALLGAAAYLGGAEQYLLVILTLLGALAGFLVFNLRCCGRARALTFMGDAGSTVIGFLIAGLFIGLSQGAERAMTPVTALWLLAVPLYDTTATMVRRLWLGRSPFDADRTHVHHQLLDAGFTVTQSVLVLSALQSLLGGIGLAGLYLALPEPLMFAGFLGLFAGYLALVGRPWRLVPRLRRLHRAFDLAVPGVSGIFVGNLPPDAAEETLRTMLSDHLAACAYELYAPRAAAAGGAAAPFALVSCADERAVRRLLRGMRRQSAGGAPLEVRQLVPREPRHDRRRTDRGGAPADQRERRGGARRLVARHAAVRALPAAATGAVAARDAETEAA